MKKIIRKEFFLKVFIGIIFLGFFMAAQVPALKKVRPALR